MIALLTALALVVAHPHPGVAVGCRGHEPTVTCWVVVTQRKVAGSYPSARFSCRRLTARDAMACAWRASREARRSFTGYGFSSGWAPADIGPDRHCDATGFCDVQPPAVIEA